RLRAEEAVDESTRLETGGEPSVGQARTISAVVLAGQLWLCLPARRAVPAKSPGGMAFHVVARRGDFRTLQMADLVVAGPEGPSSLRWMGVGLLAGLARNGLKAIYERPGKKRETARR